MAGVLAYREDVEEDALGLVDYLAILRRRRWQLIVPLVAACAIALALAAFLPAKYRSSATILIEEQEIPKDLVQSTVTSFAAQQIQVINQRVMTIDKVYHIARKHNLYGQADDSKRLPRSEVALRFRDHVKLDLISADVIDPRSGRPGQATIAFSLSFEDHSPHAAQKVANELVSQYLDENLRTRSVKAAGASEFLLAEAAALDKELIQREEQLAQFKAANEGALPELYQFNLGVVDRSERLISELNRRIQQLEKDQIEIAGQMVNMNPSAPVILPTGEVVLNEVDRLKALQSDLRKKSAIYRADHPDVLRLQREIAELQAQTGGGTDTEALAVELQRQRDELGALQARYTPDHPVVVEAKRIAADLEAELAAAYHRPSDRAQPKPDNPAYILLDTQLRSVKGEIQSLKARRIDLKQRIEEHEDLIRRAPAVEKDYQALLRGYQFTQQKFQEIKAKQRLADVARNLEQGRKGERFTLIEPPVLPLEPVSPNRLAIALLGLVCGLAGAGTVVMLQESLDTSVRTEKSIARIIGAPPLAVVAYIDNSTDQSGATREFRWVVAACLLLLLLATIGIHFLYQPLDVLWFVVLRVLGLS